MVRCMEKHPQLDQDKRAVLLSLLSQDTAADPSAWQRFWQDVLDDDAGADGEDLEALVSRGVIGFAIFMAMLIYPVYMLTRNRRLSSPWSLLLVLHICGFMIYSITDASTFIKGNYTSIYLVFMLVFYSSAVAENSRANV